MSAMKSLFYMCLYIYSFLCFRNGRYVVIVAFTTQQNEWQRCE